MSKQRNILFLSTWSRHDPLYAAYYLPNILLIQQVVGSDSQLIVQTHESTDDYGRRMEHGLLHVSTRFIPFGLKAMFFQWRNSQRLNAIVREYNITHVHPFAPPAAFMGLRLKKKFDLPLIVDSWEPHAQAMVESGVWRKNGVAYRLLNATEKQLPLVADHLIAANRGMVHYAHETWGIEVPVSKVHYRPACVNLAHFTPNDSVRSTDREEFGLGDKKVLVFAGKIGGLYLSHSFFQLLKAWYELSNGKAITLLCSPTSPSLIREGLWAVGCPEEALIHLSPSHQEMPKFLNMADCAVNIQQPVPSKRFGTPVKDGEYWAMGLPVLISRAISEDSRLIEEHRAGWIIDDWSEASVQRIVRTMLKDVENGFNRMNIRELAVKYRSYDIAEKAYREIYG